MVTKRTDRIENQQEPEPYLETVTTPRHSTTATGGYSPTADPDGYISYEWINEIHIGDSSNYVDISKTDGSVTWGGTWKKKLSLRPQLYAGRVGGVSKPTFVTYGAFAGYSFPIYSADDEELFFREFIPGRWDGVSDITAYMTCCLTQIETQDKDFAFQLSWSNKSVGSGVITNSTNDVTTPQNIDAGRTAAYSIYKLAFTIDWDTPATDVAVGDHFAGRIRRVSAGASDITSGHEVLLLDFYMTYNVDKVYKTS